MYKLTIDLPNLADGAELVIDGLGVFTVGGDNFITDEEAASYEASHVQHVPVFVKDVQVGMGQTNLTLPDLLDNLDGVSVQEFSSKTAAKKADKQEAKEIDYEEYTVLELQDMLKKAKLPVSGNKDELISRLQEGTD